MENKMKTPEEYFAEHPDVAMVSYDWNNEMTAFVQPCKTAFTWNETDTPIDWTGYDRRIAANPHFQWGKRQEIEWQDWRVSKNKICLREYGEENKLFESVNLDGGATAYRYGRYVDAPAEKPEPELSRFLPEGWEWEIFGNGRRVVPNKTYAPFWDHIEVTPIECWRYHGLLHPSEGGGFQKHTPGDPMPCDGDIMVDVIYIYKGKDHEGTNRSINIGWRAIQIPVIAWRPHFKKGGTE